MWDIIQSNRRKSAALIILLAAVIMVLGYAIGFSIESQAGGLFGVLVAMIIWVVMMLTSLTGGEQILLASAGAHEVNHDQAPQLFNVVQEMKIAAGLPVMPRVYIIDSDVPNAFAVGLNAQRAAIAVTTGLLARLNRDELQGVIGHEMGHVSNRDTLFMTLAGVTVGAIILIADLYLRGMWYGSGRSRRSSSDKGGGQAAAIMLIVAIVFAILAPILAQLLYFACSRRREYLADASSAQFTRFPTGLASALEKISAYQGPGLQISRAVAPMFTVNPLAAAGTSSVFGTHPPTADRIRVLRSMGGASLAAYDQAYRSLHNDRAAIGARNLQAADVPVREASAAQPADAASRLRQATNIMHKVNQYATIACSCGLTIKLPPGYDQPTVTCPRCKKEHPVALAPMLAMAQAAGQSLDRTQITK